MTEVSPEKYAGLRWHEQERPHLKGFWKGVLNCQEGESLNSAQSSEDCKFRDDFTFQNAVHR